MSQYMVTWLHMATALVPIYGLHVLRTTLFDEQSWQECAPPGKGIWRQRTEWAPQEGDYSLTSRTAIINLADAQTLSASPL